MSRVSICLAVWNTSHLLKRTLDTLTRQSTDDFEVVIIDDNSEDDVLAAVAPYCQDLDINVHHLEHSFGMRGNTISFNTAFSLAHGDIILESTPEIMFYPDTVRDMVKKLDSMGHRSWVSIRTYNITPEDQLLIDTVEWKNDVNLLRTLPKFTDPWTQNNMKQAYFGTHQTCAFYREDWFRYWKRFPLFADYGTDDPWHAGKRRDQGIEDATIEPMVWHQWHPPIGFWMSFDKAPNWNLWGHTMVNYYRDPEVPDGGTAMIWDVGRPEGPYHQMTEKDNEGWRVWKDTVIQTGFKRKDGEEW